MYENSQNQPTDKPALRLVIIGNYPLDHQQSMDRFAEMMANLAAKRGVVAEIWRPAVVLAQGTVHTNAGFAKWRGYVDKWVLYPTMLRRQAKSLLRSETGKQTQFLIVDHSNAFYLSKLPIDRSTITCHDVLAIRGARGDADTYCPASRMGKRLQAWILRNLVQARRIASVSETTLRQLKSLAGSQVDVSNLKNRDWRVIHNGFNAAFQPMPLDDARPLLTSVGLDANVPYILHVGSALPRKNRGMLLEMVSRIGDGWRGNIVFAGEPLEESLRIRVDELGLTDRTIEIIRPPHETLVGLYSHCDAFVFPSYSEGFGWPLIEAQACGAPVIASDVQPMPEVSNGTAFHASPDDPDMFAGGFLKLQSGDTRARMIEAGFRNVKRFDAGLMFDRYADLLWGND